MSVVVGLDVGGTKTHVRAVDPRTGAIAVDVVVTSAHWSATPTAGAVTWLATLLERTVGALPVAAYGVGAHGCEVRSECDALRTGLQARLGTDQVVVVNDAELLVPAAGHRSGTGLVLGTGAIAVTTGPDGEFLRAGGWGWVLSDGGSASALVRDAARAVLERSDEGEEPDALAEELLASVGVRTLAELAHTLSWGAGPETWGEHARAVVRAAERGSTDAGRVLDDGADAAARLVYILDRRGGNTSRVVLAGGVATAVPRVVARVRSTLGGLVPHAQLQVLDEPPVAGAVRLAVAATARTF